MVSEDESLGPVTDSCVSSSVPNAFASSFWPCLDLRACRMHYQGLFGHQRFDKGLMCAIVVISQVAVNRNAMESSSTLRNIAKRADLVGVKPDKSYQVLCESPVLPLRLVVHHVPVRWLNQPTAYDRFHATNSDISGFCRMALLIRFVAPATAALTRTSATAACSMCFFEGGRTGQPHTCTRVSSISPVT